ncbi:hypothetical protein IEQ34_017549 [Dendrobium chrysotoxum]|uniref:C3H1-type domain-containing protein n=1 Tax=Dendrobium chrysotoxum TaxID=161865 RepID=A0AAV7FU37_DENCH|nr:hypothetical protein IEQ34_017549 [Dendrobium chrysotoxum]
MASDDSLPFSSLSPRRKRERSPSQSSSSGSDNAKASRRQRRRHDLSVEVCKEFIRSACRRAEIICKFAHPPSTVTIERGKVIACADSLHNRCFRGRTCRYFHPPPHILESLLKSIRMEDTKYLMCQRSRSQSPSYDGGNAESSPRQRRLHDLSVEVCKDFIRSGCRRAEIDCKFAHPPSGVAIERCVTFIIDSNLSLLSLSSQFLKLTTVSCIFRGKVIACIDSLRGKCIRGRTCPYYHPPAQIQEYILSHSYLNLLRVPVSDPITSTERFSHYFFPNKRLASICGV